MTNRHHDLKRHMDAKHTSATALHHEGGMMDCPYVDKGCGCQGIHGFKRKDHLRDHCKRVHVRDLPTSMGGTGKRLRDLPTSMGGTGQRLPKRS